MVATTIFTADSTMIDRKRSEAGCVSKKSERETTLVESPATQHREAHMPEILPHAPDRLEEDKHLSNICQFELVVTVCDTGCLLEDLFAHLQHCEVALEFPYPLSFVLIPVVRASAAAGSSTEGVSDWTSVPTLCFPRLDLDWILLLK